MARRPRPVPDEAFRVDYAPDDPVIEGRVSTPAGELAIAGGLPGERLTVQPLRWLRGRPRRLECDIVEIDNPHPARVEPRCPSFGRCGGCSLQHLSSQGQVAFKQRHLQSLLAAAGVPEPVAWAPPIPSPTFGYRHKARLGVRFVPARGGVLVGFRERGSNRVVDAESCHILAPAIGRRVAALRRLIASLSIPASIPQLEVAVDDDRAVLVLRHLEPLTPDDLERLRAFGIATGIEMLLQSGGPETVVALAEPVAGRDPLQLEYRLDADHPDGPLRLRFGPLQFTQINPFVNRRMVARALAWLAPSRTDRVADLFCGMGNFSLPLARRAGAVIGIEGVELLVRQAAGNAALNGLRNASFAHADLYQADVRLDGEFDLALLDPPRSGAGAVLDVLIGKRPRRIVYVSCGPESFAREAAVLAAARYRLDRVGIMDMFPHTKHYETIGRFIDLSAEAPD